MKMVKEGVSDAEVLFGRLTDILEKHKRVVWLVPGGSNIGITALATRALDTLLTRRLFIMQTDERFVPIKSEDSNWWQLYNAGFDQKHAWTFPVLNDHEERSLLEVAKEYNVEMKREFEKADYIIGQFGIGADGHTAGIKPDSPAVRSEELVCGYESEDFKRVTMTLGAIRKVDEALVFSFGEEKRSVLERLANGEGQSPPFPAGIFNGHQNVTLYNDQVEN